MMLNFDQGEIAIINLTEQSAIVTGGGSGIGLGLAAEGVKVAGHIISQVGL